jgi:glycosyltransferase involved in cell wall biosynthesis
VPVPYRERLFARLAERGQIDIKVIYQAGLGAGWDQRPDWFPERHPYPAGSLQAWQRARPGRSPVALPRGLGRALGRFGPDCVTSWEYGAATMRALAWCRVHRRRLVVFSELTPHSDGELSSRRLRLHRLLARRVDGFVVASSAGRRRLEAMGVDRERIEVALQSADVEAFRAAAVGQGSRGGPPFRVLSVGRLVPDKNLAALIQAFAEAGFEAGEAELELRGEGPLEGELRDLAGRLGVPVRFGGYAAPAELPSIYAGAGALALVSSYEPFGVAVREAAASGLPIVCSRTAGAAGDVAVEGENALLVDPGERDQIAVALRRLVREPALRARLAEGSRAVTERHPPEADAEAFERAVLGALSRSELG